MAFLQRSVRDCRGVRRSVYGTGFGLGAHTEPETLPPEVMERLRVRLVPMDLGMFFARHQLILGATVVSTVGLLLLALAMRSVLFPLVLAWPALVVFAVGRVLLRRSFAGHSPHEVAAALLDEHHCPSCGYELSGARGDWRQSIVDCPECGAAWKVPWALCAECGRRVGSNPGVQGSGGGCPKCAEVEARVRDRQAR